MKKRLLLSVLVCIIIGKSHSQVSQKLKYIDSIESQINGSIHSNRIRKDTGSIISPTSKTRVGSYKKEFYIDKKTSKLNLVIYFQIFQDGTLVNESYYYSNEVPISAYRFKRLKKKTYPETAFYFYNNELYENKDSAFVISNDKIKANSLKFLRDYENLR